MSGGDAAAALGRTRGFPGGGVGVSLGVVTTMERMGRQGVSQTVKKDHVLGETPNITFFLSPRSYRNGFGWGGLCFHSPVAA